VHEAPKFLELQRASALDADRVVLCERHLHMLLVAGDAEPVEGGAQLAYVDSARVVSVELGEDRADVAAERRVVVRGEAGLDDDAALHHVYRVVGDA